MYEIHFERAEHFKELKSGFRFVVRKGEYICCRGRMKPSSGLHFDRGSGAPPTREVAVALDQMATAYVEESVEPEDRVFKGEESKCEVPGCEESGEHSHEEKAEPEPEPEPETKPKRKPRKRKAKEAEE